MKIHNYVNELKTAGLKTKQRNLFIAILRRLQENSYKIGEKDKRRTIEFTYAELKKMGDVKYRGNKRFSEMLEGFMENILSIREKIEITKGKKTIFNIFSKIEMDDNEHILSVTVNKDFEHFLFEVNDCYSNLNIEEYTGIKSSHTKGMYRFINQWKSLGIKEIEIEAFKNLFEIPKSYEMCHLTEKIIKPAVKELDEFFPGLSFEKVKEGKRVTKLIFTWQRIERKKKVTKKQEMAVPGTGTGSKKIFNKELAEEKTIKAEKEIANLKAEERLAEIVKTNLSNNVAEEPIIEVTSDKYMEIYNDYLKANNIEHSVYVKKAFDIINKNKVRIKENKKAF